MRTLLAILFSAFLAASLTACDDGKAENFGEKVDETMEDAGDAIDDAADNVKDAADDACEKATGENC